MAGVLRDRGGVFGLESGMMTAFQMSMGGFHVDDFTNTLSTMFFVLFMFLTVVIMLVRAICLSARPPLPSSDCFKQQPHMHAIF